MMDELKWALLTEVYGRLEAEWIKSYLQSQDIESELFQEAIGHHAFPTTIDGLARVQIFVSKEQLDEAKSLLEEYRSHNVGTMSATIILITRNGMGNAEEKLQKILIAKYFDILLQQSELPAALCFYTDGVKLTTEGSPVIDQLRALESKGVRLIICSTCLNYFNLIDKVEVGIVGGMGDIIEAQMKAEKAITI